MNRIMAFSEFVKKIKESARSLPAKEIDWHSICPDGLAVFRDPRNTHNSVLLNVRVKNYYHDSQDEDEFFPHIEIAVQRFTGHQWEGPSLILPLYNLVGGSTDGFERATEFISSLSSPFLPVEQRTELLKCAGIFDEAFFPERVQYGRYEFVK